MLFKLLQEECYFQHTYFKDRINSIKCLVMSIYYCQIIFIESFILCK